MPPEIRNNCNKPIEKQKRYSGPAADIFTVGIILFAMKFKGYPFVEAIKQD